MYNGAVLVWDLECNPTLENMLPIGLRFIGFTGTPRECRKNSRLSALGHDFTCFGGSGLRRVGVLECLGVSGVGFFWWASVRRKGLMVHGLGSSRALGFYDRTSARSIIGGMMQGQFLLRVL